MRSHLIIASVVFGIITIAVARLVLLRLAKSMQRRRGYSDEFVTEMAVAVPLAAFVIVICGVIYWASL